MGNSADSVLIICRGVQISWTEAYSPYIKLFVMAIRNVSLFVAGRECRYEFSVSVDPPRWTTDNHTVEKLAYCVS